MSDECRIIRTLVEQAEQETHASEELESEILKHRGMCASCAKWLEDRDTEIRRMIIDYLRKNGIPVFTSISQVADHLMNITKKPN